MENEFVIRLFARTGDRRRETDAAIIAWRQRDGAWTADLSRAGVPDVELSDAVVRELVVALGLAEAEPVGPVAPAEVPDPENPYPAGSQAALAWNARRRRSSFSD